MIWLLQVGVSWTYSSCHVTCRCPGSTSNAGGTAETTAVLHWEFLFIISFPSARTVGAAILGSCPAPATPWSHVSLSGWKALGLVSAAGDAEGTLSSTPVAAACLSGK